MSYLDYLPAVFQEEADPSGFLAAYLQGFEQVLTGHGDPQDAGLEEVLDGIPGAAGPQLGGLERYFTPQAAVPELQTEAAFLRGWRSGWPWRCVRTPPKPSNAG